MSKESKVSGEAKEAPEDSVTIILKKPIQFGEEKVTCLVLREPEARHMREFPTGAPTTGHLLDLAGSVCGRPPSFMNKLCLKDTLEVVQAMANFIGPSLPTGKS